MGEMKVGESTSDFEVSSFSYLLGNKIERVSAQLHILDLALYVLFMILKLWPLGDSGHTDGSGGSGSSLLHWSVAYANVV